MSKRIAVVDDEQDIRELVSLHLTRAGFKVREFPDVTSLLTYLRTTIPDLIVLDLMLPDADGMDICRQLRNDESTAAVPVIMLTARTEETDRILGLELGADDYVTKPFSPRELVARVKAVLRRGRQEAEQQTIQVGDMLEIDCKKYQVTVKGERVELTSTEFRIVRLLAERPGWVYTRDRIREGESLHAPMKRTKVFPPIVTNLISVGEEAGNLEEILNKLSDYYDSEIDATIRSLASMIEPLLIIVIGAIVGVIVVGLYLPIFKLIDVIK